MLIALPNVDGSFTVTLFLPNQGDESFEALTTTDAVYALFERRFADAIPLMPRLGEDFFENPTGHLETIRCEPWSFEDHALVLGDAAHAIVPFHGQGMNAAFEDCSAFDRCLGDPDRPWNEIFTQFEERRRPDTDAIADMALENYVEMRSTVREPKFQLKKDLSFRLEERHPGRFIPRYSMVMFHTIPYAEAKRRGAIQEEILEELTSTAASLDEVDLARADRLIARQLGKTVRGWTMPHIQRDKRNMYHAAPTTLRTGMLLVVCTCLTLAHLTTSTALAQHPRSTRAALSDYRVIHGWPVLPEGMILGQVSGVGVDSHNHVYVFRRAEKPWSDNLPLDANPAATVMVFEGATGNLHAAWGENVFVMPHGLTVDRKDNIWLTDVGLHQVFKFDHAGKLLISVGERGVPGADGSHFNRPTDVAVASDGSFFVSDGYINSRVAAFSPEGRYLFEWGQKETGLGSLMCHMGLR